MDITNFKNNWKKIASASMKKEEAELAFAKIASATISSKAAPFFKDPYYLGFEIVKTFNDSFSKMVGIFVFRVEEKFFYVPVFFVDGSIKCTDLLYVKDDSLFTLLSPEWCDFYINKSSSSKIGDLTKEQKGSANGANQDLQLRWLAFPPYMAKGASVKNLVRKEGYKAESPLVIFDFLKQARDIFSKEDYEEATKKLLENEKTASEPGKSRLHDLVVAGGYEMFEKLASWMETDYEFANNMVTFFDTEDYMPKEVLEAERQKTASAIKTASTEAEDPHAAVRNKEGKILLHMGKFNPYTTKTAAEQIAVGMSIEDNRPTGEIEPLVVDPIEQFNGIDSGCGYGIYDVLTSAGDIAKAFIISGVSDYGKRPGLIISLEPDDKGVIAYDNTSDSENLYGGRPAFFRAGSEPAGIHKQRQAWANILANRDYENEDKKCEEVVKDKPEAGNVYGIFDADSSYISDEAFYIKSVNEEADGLTIIATPLYGYTNINAYDLSDEDKEVTIRVNKDALKILTDLKVFTPKTKWIKIPVTTYKPSAEAVREGLDAPEDVGEMEDNKYKVETPDWVPGNLNTFLRAIHAIGYKHASVVYDHRNDTYKLDYDGATQESKYCGKFASTVKLMGELNYSEEDANTILDLAKENGTKGFSFMYKSAARIILNPEPTFFEGYDSDLGIKYSVPETIPLRTQDLSVFPPAPRYGDFNPSLTPGNPVDAVVNQKEETTIKENENGDVFLRTASPNMLASLARETGKDSLFEHGVIGALTQAHDASTFLSEFLPDLFQGEDKLGRILFLINLSPASFISMYGSDDIKSLENNIVNIFKQQGELILELSQKNKTSQDNVTSVDNTQ